MRRSLPAVVRLGFVATVLFSGCATTPTEYREPVARTPAARTAQNLAVFDRGWSLIDQKYFEPQFRGVNWAAQRARYRPDAAAATDEASLYRTLHQPCAELKQSHLFAYSPRQVHAGRLSRQANLGMSCLWLDEHWVVADVLPEGAAADAGVRRGWRIVSRNAVALTRESVFASKPEEPEHYVFLDDHDQSHGVALTPGLGRRAALRRESRELAGGVRYLRFDSFNPVWPLWLNREIRAHRSAPGMIVDLRQNPGGHARTLYSFLGQFFKERVDGGSFQRRGRQPIDKEGSSIFSSYDGPLVVLVSERTGSAAEIFAHVTQHHKRATIVGRRTAGAVLMSFNHRLPDGGYLVIPEQDYVGVDGQRLEGRGVTPDIAVPAPTPADLQASQDRDVAAALQVLSQR